MGAFQAELQDRAVASIVGVSEWCQQVRALILAVANYPSSVMISGQTGTGKELIARAIHAVSCRADHPFIPVDCASIDGPLFASHMFGHLKGAFTGATYSAMGCFRAADGGTIFLDEIGELEFELQAKLLRALQEQMVVPLGGHQGVPVDARVVAASNRDLRQELAAGRFRQDLYYRLNVVEIQTIPLCDRAEDVQLLAQHFLAKFAIDNALPMKGVAPGALSELERCRWPGNVRQLQNVLERAVLFTRGTVIDRDSVLKALDEEERDCFRAICFPTRSQSVDEAVDVPPAPTTTAAPSVAAEGDEHWQTLDEIERGHIKMTLEHTYYNQSAAARLMGIDRNLLRRKVQRLGIDVSRSHAGRPCRKPDP